MNFIKSIHFITNKTHFIKTIPLRNFTLTPINFKALGNSSPKPWKLPSASVRLQPNFKSKVERFFREIQKNDCVSFKDVKTHELQEFLGYLINSKIIDRMNWSATLQVLIGIMNNKSFRNHKINDIAVNALITKIEDVPFHRLAFLDYLIQKLELSESYQELRRNIQQSFLLKMNELIVNCDDVSKFKQILTYMADNANIVSLEALETLSLNLMETDLAPFDINDMNNAIILFSKFDYLSDVSALKKIVNKWYELNPQLRDIEVLLSLLFCSMSTNLRHLQHANLFELIFKRLEETSCGEKGNEKISLSCFKRLINMGYRQQSIDLMSKLFERGIFHENVNFFIKLYVACEDTGYKPENWKSVILPAFEKFEFEKHIEQHPNFGWPRFALKMFSSEHTNFGLIKALVESKKYKDGLELSQLKNILKKKFPAKV